MTDWDVAVVGAGIAGLTAARTAAAHGCRTVAFERLGPGGRLINLGEPACYPGLAPGGTGADLAAAVLTDAMESGVEVVYAEVTGLAGGPPLTLLTADGACTASAVVVATGTTEGSLDVPGAADWSGRGVSDCADCDGPLFAGRRVAVVGDDEWAARDAFALAGLATHVTVLAPGRPGWSAAAADRMAAHPAVEVRTAAPVTALVTADAVRGVRLADGTEVDAAGVFVHTGRSPRAGLLDGAAGAVHAAGDVRDGAVRYLMSAAADGLRAGLAAAAQAAAAHTATAGSPLPASEEE